MADQEIKNFAVKVSMDSTGFQNGVSGIKNQLAVVKSEFKAASAEMGGLGNSEDQLKLKSASLNQQITLQRQVVESLSKAVEKSAADKGLDAKATQDLQIKLNAARTALAGMENSLKNTNTQLEAGAKQTGKFDTAVGKLKVSGESIKLAFGAIGLAAASYLGSALNASVKAEQGTARLTTLLQDQGLTAAEAPADIKKLPGEITKISTFSPGEAKEALQVLADKGIEAGKALEMEGMLADVAAGRNISLADAADMMASAYNGKTKALVALGILTKDEVKQLGDTEDATISLADVQQRLNERYGGAAQKDRDTFAGQMKVIGNTMNDIKKAIGDSLLPLIKPVASELASIVKPIQDFVKAHPAFVGAVLAITAALGTVLGATASFTVFKLALAPLAPMMAPIGAALSSAFLPMIAVISAVAAISYVLYKNWDSIKPVMD